MFRSSLLIFLYLLALGSCAHEATAPADAILILPGAVNVRSERGFGDKGSEYNLVDADLTSAIRNVSAHLASHAWQPLANHPQHPNQPTSFEGGWVCFPEANAIVFQWLSAWRDEEGNVVMYDFRSNAESVAKGRGDLEVRATFLNPADVDARNQARSSSPDPNLSTSEECLRIQSSTLVPRSGQ